MNSRPFVLALAFVLLLGATGRAGPEVAPGEDRDAIALLQSDLPEDVAWGAWIAGRDGLAEAEPLLLRVLLPRPDRESTEWSFALLSVLDALVVTDAKVPGEVLLPYARGRTSIPVLVLLTRDVSRNRDALLTLFEHSGPDRNALVWLAAGNLLAKSRAAGFPARLLDHVKPKLSLTVCDSERMFGFGSSSMSIRCGDGRVTVPPRFPPTPVYRLYQDPGDGLVELAEGVRPVYYRRTVREEPRFGVGSTLRGISGTTCALEWLGRLLAGGEGVSLEEKRSANILWVSPEEYLARATSARDAILDDYWAVVRALVAKELLTVEEANEVVPEITVTVKDRRVDRSVPLPEIRKNPDRPTFSK